MSIEQGAGRLIAGGAPLGGKGKIRRNTVIQKESGRRPMVENKGMAFGLALLVHLVLFSCLVCMKLPAGNGTSSVIRVELSGGTRGSGPAGGLHQGGLKAAAKTSLEPPARQSPAIAATVPAAAKSQPAVPPKVSRQLAADPRTPAVLAVTEPIRPLHLSQPFPHPHPAHRIPPQPVAPRNESRGNARIAGSLSRTADTAQTTGVSTAGAAGNGTAGHSSQAGQSSPKGVAAANGTGSAEVNGFGSTATNGSGSGAASQAGIRSYLAAVRARIEAAKQYPPNARRRGIEGRAMVRFRLAADGQLLVVRLAAASGFRELDQAALSAVRRAAPFPGFPGQDSGPRSFKVDISFVLRDAL